MAETENHEDRIRRLADARKEMEDALIVVAHLDSKATARIKEHAEFIANHEASMELFDQKLQQHATSMLEFDAKVNALINIVGRMQGGIESHS